MSTTMQASDASLQQAHAETLGNERLDERQQPLVHVHCQRDTGIGYGNSSGYGSQLHFTDGHVDSMFRFRW